MTLGVQFIKAEPTTHVVHYRNGRIVRSGAGLSFLYFAPNSSLVMIPLQSVDVPFSFQELTADFQQVVVQGQFTYRIKDPVTVANFFNYGVTAEGFYVSEDPEKLRERLLHLARVLTRSAVHPMKLTEALGISDDVCRKLFAELASAPQVVALGVEILDYTITSVKPTPEMIRALEATTRESLNKAADEAIYQRRNAAVDSERVIKENELTTELAIQEKNRGIKEAQLNADIALEQTREELVERKAANDKKESDAKAYALEAILKPLKGADWKTLTAAISGGQEPGMMIATAFREMAENSSKIGELNISPDLLATLLGKKK